MNSDATNRMEDEIRTIKSKSTTKNGEVETAMMCWEATNNLLKNSVLSLLDLLLSGDLLALLVYFLKIACLHVSFTAYENFYQLSKMYCHLVLTFHFPIFRMSECRNPTIKHIFTYTLISPFISTYVIDLFLVILFT